MNYKNNEDHRVEEGRNQFLDGWLKADLHYRIVNTHYFEVRAFFQTAFEQSYSAAALKRLPAVIALRHNTFLSCLFTVRLYNL
jgi:hypothetical protein